MTYFFINLKFKEIQNMSTWGLLELLSQVPPWYRLCSVNLFTYLYQVNEVKLKCAQIQSHTSFQRTESFSFYVRKITYLTFFNISACLIRFLTDFKKEGGSLFGFILFFNHLPYCTYILRFFVNQSHNYFHLQ